MNIRQMTTWELVRACWSFWFWGALIGANAGCAIGEAFGQGRFWLAALNVFGTAASMLMASEARKASTARIEAFYAQQLRDLA
jgi:hypothetical protein